MRTIGLALILLLAPTSAATQDFDFYADGPYRSGVPRPATLLRYEPGEFHTNYGNMLRVTDAIAEAATDWCESSSTAGRWKVDRCAWLW